jgi:hypothetical protein
VFSELRDELSHRPTREGTAPEVAITFITHGECHIPTALVQSLRQGASLYGIFVLPSQPLDLEYVALLSGHQVISADTIAQPAEKRRRALDVVTDVVATVRRTV